MESQRHVLIVGDGDVDDAELARLAAAGSFPSAPEATAAHPLVLAADGGAARCHRAGIQPDIVIGDLDSLAPGERTRLEGLGVEFRVRDRAKDESDMELCLWAALEAGATRIAILGALGMDRPEHSIANLLLLAHPRLDGLDVAIVGRGSRITRIGSADGPGQARIEGKPGDYVSLFAVGGDVAGLTTTGLRFPLRDEALPVGPSRGLSNELLRSSARVGTRRGRLLIVHTSAQPDSLHAGTHVRRAGTERRS
jgi:thiamine pyrophosphokinase